jgi:nucleoside-diphosphate-sugar epimerase
VLVTGASGFIGAHLCRELERLGAELHATSRRERAEEGRRWHGVDLADAGGVADLVERVRPEVLFHLASHVAGSRDRSLVLPTFGANLASTVHLLDAVTRTGGCRRFVQVGSMEEREPGEGDEPPASPYAAAKAAATAYCRMFHRLYDTPVVLARLFMVYGPAQGDLEKLIPYLILELLRGGEPKLSSGERPVDWIYVDDVVRGLVRAGFRSGRERPGLEGRRVDLGSGELVTIRELVERLYRIVGVDATPPFGTLPDRPMEQVRKARVEESAELLGWHPEVGLDEGLRCTVDWYRRELEAGRV